MFIYKIQNLVNNKVYIGQSCQKTKSRLYEHKLDLKKNIHHNPHLQRAWNKYGEKNFSFDVITKAKSLKELNKLEVFYIQKYNSLNKQFGYNIRSGGDNSKLSEETKRKISKSKKGIPVHTPESINKIKKFLTGRKHSLKSRIKRSEKLKGIKWSNTVINSWVISHRKGVPYPKVIDPDGNVYKITNATKFARKHNLVQQSLSKLVNGKLNNHRGWTILQENVK